MRIRIFLLTIFIFLNISCEKIVEPLSKEIFITKFNMESMRKEHLSGFKIVRKRARFNEGREFVFENINNSNNIFIRVGIFQSKERAQEIAEEYNSWCWITPNEDSMKILGIGDRCWWMPDINSPDTVAFHFIHNNVFIIVNSNKYSGLLQLTKLIDRDIIDGANYIEKAGSIIPPKIYSIHATKTVLREGETAKITVNASDPDNEPLEYVCIGLIQAESDPENVFTFFASRDYVPEPFWGSHIYKFQVVNESNVLSQIAEFELKIIQ